MLVNFTGGQTAILTLGRGSTKSPLLHLMVVGNHGMLRLEGGDEFDGQFPSQRLAPESWRAAINQSLGRSAAVSLDSD